MNWFQSKTGLKGVVVNLMIFLLTLAGFQCVCWFFNLLTH